MKKKSIKKAEKDLIEDIVGEDLEDVLGYDYEDYIEKF